MDLTNEIIERNGFKRINPSGKRVQAILQSRAGQTSSPETG